MIILSLMNNLINVKRDYVTLNLPVRRVHFLMEGTTTNISK